jgi:small subunit ribosomal protein S8
MSLSDPLGDMLTRIRNGQMANKSAIKAPASKLRSNVLEVLRREGYIRNYEIRREQILINVPPATVRHLRFQPAPGTIVISGVS